MGRCDCRSSVAALTVCTWSYRHVAILRPVFSGAYPWDGSLDTLDKTHASRLNSLVQSKIGCYAC